jgi:hypothetical protein
MRTVLISICIGTVAGIIDIIPMLIQKLDKRATISAFIQYLFVGIIIVNINLFGMIWWIQGGLISFALSIPVIIIVSVNDKKSVPIISLMSIVLGTLIGIAGHFIK